MSRKNVLLVEWEDSSLGPLGWQQVDELKAPKPIKIASVGWIVRRTKRSLVLAQNVGGLDGRNSGQASNIITIPCSCILSERWIA